MISRYMIKVGFAAMIFASGVAGAIDVTFQVDMRYQPGFDPAIDFVGPRGSLKPLDWHKTFVITDANNDSIYVGTAHFDDTLVGRTLYYWFVFGVDSCWAVTYEEPLSTLGTNRVLTIPYADTILPAVYFSDIDKPPTAIDVTVTFNVSTQYVEIYVPDSVAVRGTHDSLNWWNLGQWPYMEFIGDNRWKADITFPAGTSPYIWYKYNGHDPTLGWQWEPIATNRLFSINDSNSLQTLAVDFYGQTPIDVTFRVFVGYQPGFPQDTVAVRGYPSPLDWGCYDNMLTDADGDSIYEGIVTFSPAAIGDTIYYKFVYRYVGEDRLEEPISTGGANREFVLADADTILPIVYYADINRPPLRQKVKVTFNVTLVPPSADSVAIAGSVAPLDMNLGTPPYMTQADATTWTANVTFAQGCSPYVTYKYQGRDSLSGWAWEPIVSDRTFWIDDSAPDQALPMSYWGYTGMGTEEIIIANSRICTLLQNYPNPFNSVTTIKFQLPEEGKTVLTIHNLAGQKVNTLLDAKLSAGFYTTSWDGRDAEGLPVVGGIYFYRMTFESNIGEANFVSAKKLMLIK